MSSEKCCENYSEIVDGEGERFCGGCGFVIGREVSGNLGEKLFDADNIVDTVHNAPLDTVSYVSTTIGNKKTDSSGKSISKETSRTMKRIELWDNRARFREKNGLLFREMGNHMSKLNMKENHIIEAKKLLSKYIKSGLSKSKPLAETESAIIYAINKKYDLGKTLKEISGELIVEPKRIWKAYKKFNVDFMSNSEDYENDNENVSNHRKNKTIHVNRILSDLDLPESFRSKIKKYMTKIMELPEMQIYLGGKSLLSVDAAIIYCIKGHDEEIGPHLYQKKIAKACGVTEVTIRNRYREIDDIVERSGRSDQIWKSKTK